MQHLSRAMCLALLVGMVMLSSSLAALPQPNTAPEAQLTDAQGRTRVLVTFRTQAVPRLIERLGGRVDRVFRIAPIVSCSIREANIGLLWRIAGVEFVEPERVVRALYTTGETVPWGIARIRAPEAYSGGATGAGATIAVLDTGLDLSHPDLAARCVGGHDYVNGDDVPDDENGHGTHVSGIAAASDNRRGIVGAAPAVGVYAVKFLDALGFATTSDEIQAVQWASEHGANVITMSFGASRSSWAEKRALRQAYNRGALLVAAGGNDGDSRNTYPAAYPFVIAAGATDGADQRASFSNTNKSIELAAPGVGIYSAMPTYDVLLTLLGYNYSYDYLSGTSMATPHIAGAAALVFAAYPGWTNSQVRQRLAETARDLGPAGRDTSYGYGLVDAAAAVGAGSGGTPSGDVGAIQGTVTQNGWPAGFRQVVLLDEGGATVATTQTDWQGKYGFSQVSADDSPATFYRVRASSWSGSVTSGPIDLQPGQVVTVNLAL